MTIDQLKPLRETEDRVEFKEAWAGASVRARAQSRWP